MKKRRPIRLTPADAEAVLAALPLVVEFEADTARQQTINPALILCVAHISTLQYKNITTI